MEMLKNYKQSRTDRNATRGLADLYGGKVCTILNVSETELSLRCYFEKHILDLLHLELNGLELDNPAAMSVKRLWEIYGVEDTDFNLAVDVGLNFESLGAREIAIVQKLLSNEVHQEQEPVTPVAC